MQINLPATPLLESHYHLVGLTRNTLTTLGTIQVDIVLDRMIWPMPAIAVSSLPLPLILGLNFFKLTKSKIDFKTSNVKVGPKTNPEDMCCVTKSNSVITIPTSDIYRLCRLLLNKKACWMVTNMLIIVIILTAYASHTHCHLKLPFKKQEESFVPPKRNRTWKELLTSGTSIRFSVRSQPEKFKKTCLLYLLDWAIPSVLAKKLHLTTHLVLGVYNPLHPRNTTLIQTATHTRCHFIIRDKEHPGFPIKGPNKIP